MDVSNKNQKVKGVNKRFVAKRSHNEYKDVLQNQKYSRYLTNRFQSKIHRIETYEINKISILCFDDIIHILNNGI